MIYFLHGDSNKIFKKATAMADSLLKKKPDAGLFKISQDNFSEDKINELIGGQGLFSNKYVVQMSRVLERDENADFLLSKIKELKSSENIFIWAEEKVDKKTLEKIEKYSEKVQNFDVVKKIEKKLDVFKLADLLGQKNKKDLWIKYNELIQHVPPEEIFGILWWQVKTMMITAQVDSAKDADMKDFVYKKSKSYLKNFKSGELENLAKKLIVIYHESRSESENLSLNLEKFLLSV